MFVPREDSKSVVWAYMMVSRRHLLKITTLLIATIFILSLSMFSSDLAYTYQIMAAARFNSGETASSRHTSASAYDAKPPHYTGPTPEVVAFWNRLANELSKAEPKGERVAATRLDLDQFSPHGSKAQIDIDVLRLPPKQLESLRNTHHDFVQRLRHLAPDLPFVPNTRGVVMTASGAKLGIASTALLMLRRAGSKLPVQLFLNSASEYERNLCKSSLGPLNVQCLNMDDFLQVPKSASYSKPNFNRFEFKAFALIFSSFQNILFLDADCFPIRNPDHILDVEPFKSHGMVTWPDFWLPTISPLFYDIAEVQMPNRTMSSRASESGMMLFDKKRHADTLLLAGYYNFYGKYYYQLHSQGAWGAGDKETFTQGAVVLGNPFYQVKTSAVVFTVGKIHYGSGIWQADPEMDWKSYTGKAEKRESPPVMPTLFAHLNGVKFDTRQLSKWMDELVSKKEDGKKEESSRIMGSDYQRIVKMAGYDLEKAIWEEAIKANCDHALLQECERFQKYYEAVFGKGT